MIKVVVIYILELKVLGSIAYCKYSKHYAQIGVYWMMEDYRHSGIGMKLFTYAMEQLAGTTNIIFNSGKTLIYMQ